MDNEADPNVNTPAPRKSSSKPKQKNTPTKHKERAPEPKETGGKRDEQDREPDVEEIDVEEPDDVEENILDDKTPKQNSKTLKDIGTVINSLPANLKCKCIWPSDLFFEGKGKTTHKKTCFKPSG